jgi:hypothetical protein
LRDFNPKSAVCTCAADRETTSWRQATRGDAHRASAAGDAPNIRLHSRLIWLGLS